MSGLNSDTDVQNVQNIDDASIHNQNDGLGDEREDGDAPISRKRKRSDSEEEVGDAPSGDNSLQTVFVATEICLPISPNDVKDANYAGVQILGVFSTVDEANACAAAQVKNLENLTKRERELEDDFAEFIVPYVADDDPFSGTWQRTEPVKEHDDGTKTFKVLWTDRSTTITVDKQTVYESARSAPAKDVLHYATAVHWT